MLLGFLCALRDWLLIFKMAAAWRFLYGSPFTRFSSSKRLSCLLYEALNRRSFSRLLVERTVFTSAVSGREENELERNPFYDKYAEKIKIVNNNISVEGK
jgi:hypothetical protein